MGIWQVLPGAGKSALASLLCFLATGPSNEDAYGRMSRLWLRRGLYSWNVCVPLFAEQEHLVNQSIKEWHLSENVSEPLSFIFQDGKSWLTYDFLYCPSPSSYNQKDLLCIVLNADGL